MSFSNDLSGFFFSSRRRHTRLQGDWSSDVCSSDLLIINNVVYGNGGRCIHAYIVTNFWIVNNTCYNNNLDPTLGTAGSFSTSGSQNGYFINNLSLAWSSAYPTYIQEGSNSNIQYFADMY